MSVDDVVFFSSLFVCISLGSYYKKIDDVDMKRHYGAGLGILVACMICGHYIFHTILMVWGNIIIIKCCNKSYMHQLSLAYTWTYLLYLHLNLSDSIYVIWLHQTLALRLVGLSFEMAIAEKTKIDPTAMSTSKLSLIDESLSREPTAVDIITYAYYFIGIHKGPYYRWRIYNDHFNVPFGMLGDCRIITEEKLKKATICVLGYVLLRIRYSSEVYYDEDFYVNHTSDYRFLYNLPVLMMYFLKYQALMMLCTSVCTETGFGVYPAKCQPIPGYGPTSNMSLIKLASGTPDVALGQEYNFSMLRCFANNKILFGPRMKDTMRSWDMPTQYWFWANIYRNFIKSNKGSRGAVSFIAWTLWCGPSLQQLLVSATLWLFVQIEAEFAALYSNTTMKVPWDIGYSIMRIFCLLYLTPCFMVEDINVVLLYYNSIFWVFHWVLLILMIIAIILNKARKM